LTVWNAALSLVLGAGGLVVDSASPDALCPPLEATRATVAARLGNVELDGAWRASYVVVHRAEGDFVSLTLIDPEGSLRLQRELPVRGGSCETLSQVIALVLERFFQQPEAASPEPAAPPPPAQAPPRAEAEQRIAAPAARAEASRSALESRPAAGALAAPPALVQAASEPTWSVAAAFWASNAWLAPEARLARRLAERYRVALSAAFDLDDHEVLFARGSVSTQRVPLSLGVSRQMLGRPWVRPHVGIELLTVLERARTRRLEATGDGVRAVPGLGIRVGADFLGAEQVGPFAELTVAALFRAAAPAFEVEHQEVQRAPGLVVGLALGVRSPL
jgi:hypothetical protein